jgi:short-subunit dehydrogenase
MPLLREVSNSKQGRKRLVFHSSYLGKLIEPGNVPFAISKMALEGLCDAIRLENYYQDISGNSSNC